MKSEKRVCSICGKEFTGYGNNAEPINNGICCDECNVDIVIQRRINEYFENDLSKKKNVNENDVDCVKKNVASKEECIEFVVEFLDIKHFMVTENAKLEAKYSGTEYKEMRSKLFEKTTEKLIDLAKRKLDARMLQGLLLDFIGYVGDDMDIIVRLYAVVNDDIPVIVAI